MSQIEKKIIVFLGPSLSLDEAKKILPEACYMPPVRCGDVLHVMRLQPKIIVIIDGYFEQCSAVWHKEILFALEKGVLVIGASSMGALRAAELHAQGMVGVGEIYKNYLNGTYRDDDEVAVSHLSEKNDYQSKNIPLVNWRATLNHLFKKKLITQIEWDAFFNAAKSEFYPNRNTATVFKKLNKFSSIESLWNDHYVDQKKKDAILALNQASYFLNNDVDEEAVKVSTPITLFFRSLLKQSAAQAFPGIYSWLPEQEKLVSLSRLLGENYRLSKRLAYLMATVPEKFWKNVKGEVKIPDNEIFQFMKISGDYVKFKSIQLFKEKKPLKFKILSCTAFLWKSLEKELLEKQFFPTNEAVSRCSVDFRQQHNLIDESSFKAWLTDNDLSKNDYVELIVFLVKFNYFVIDGNDFSLDKYFSDKIYYLYEALRLTGACEQVKSLLKDMNSLEKELEHIFKQYKEKGVMCLYGFDFSGEHSFYLFVNQVRAFAESK